VPTKNHEKIFREDSIALVSVDHDPLGFDPQPASVPVVEIMGV
jgi:hypothetical protein